MTKGQLMEKLMKKLRLGKKSTPDPPQSETTPSPDPSATQTENQGTTHDTAMPSGTASSVQPEVASGPPVGSPVAGGASTMGSESGGAVAPEPPSPDASAGQIGGTSGEQKPDQAKKQEELPPDT
tara:strand:+ start:5914 stop:6288 length:375 start_codon:yes stop_codon:yes gene_type:complete